MVADSKARNIPWCSICLVISAITCHTLVLLGNWNTSAMFSKIGHSTKGWSHIGQNLGYTLEHELDELMAMVTTKLTSTINETLMLKSSVDEVIFMIGNATDTHMGNIDKKASQHAFIEMVKEASAWRFSEKQAQKIGGDMILAKGDLPHDRPPALTEEAESEVMWMMETSRVTKSRSPSLPIEWQKIIQEFNPNHISIDSLKTPLKNLKIPTNISTITADYEIVAWALAHPKEVAKDLTSLANGNRAKANEIFHNASKHATEYAIKEINSAINAAMKMVSEKIDQFLELIKPALLQIGKWLQSFGTKVQTIMEGFSNTLDKVQKIFDQIMAKIAQSKGLEKMVHDTYNLFDASHTGSVSVSDLQEVGQVYGITALAGEKAAQLLAKYDSDENESLEKQEFELFVQDPAIPGAMAVVLRAYSKKLAHISGQVARATKRDEVASAVVKYLSLVSAKNMTKVGWVATSLTNGSLPMAFTADILKNLAEQVDNPDKLYSTDPGPIIVKKMVEINHNYVTQVLSLMSEPEFWQGEGFDTQDQARYVQRVTEWVTEASAPGLLDIEHGKFHTQLYSLFGGRAGEEHSAKGGGKAPVSLLVLEAMPSMAAELVEERCRRYDSKQRAYRATQRAKLFSSSTAKVLFNELLSGTTAGSTDEDPAATAAINSGVPAKPETLQFAKFLSYNSSDTASRFQDQCADYMGDSSSQLDSFATQIQTMTKKIQSFLKQMMQYSTPTGIAKLETTMKDFVVKAENKVKKVVLEKVYSVAKEVEHFNIALVQEMPEHQALRTDTEDPQEVFMKVKTALDELQTVLPPVIDNLKFAKTEVAAVSKQLPSVFASLEGKGPPIFHQVSELYKNMWTAYYTLFVTLTAGVFFYAFWATGWCGGPQASEPLEDGFEPASFRDRVRTVCSACCACVSNCHDNAQCFWSCIIFSEVIVLLLFIVAIVLSLLSGIKAFLGSGCAEIYFLSDDKICQGILGVVKGFLEKFWANAADGLDSVCQHESLLTCHLIEEKLMTSVLYTTLGSIVAAVLTFQMIIDTAQLHEQVRWRRIYDQLYKSV